ncbi:MAG TPA: hypothetical protein VKI61_19915, partial [Chitinophagaceae bacterium]|nr:hypothetical protein [Chitinophagaceae bacterium]
MNLSSEKDFSTLFKQYLTTTQVPVLEYYFKTDSLHYRWTNCVEGFNMPVEITVGKDKDFFINPLTSWQKLLISKEYTGTLVINSNFYTGSKESN